MRQPSESATDLPDAAASPEAVPAARAARHAAHLRAIADAAGEVTSAYERLTETVADARAAGEPWSVIGAALGTSGADARRRFGSAEVGDSD
ncbi:hypothetical protein [Demequina phytophila]|uniref:hypothetical protein n=1 Tax=Demequina phytophila TaxID=1638981 RepID=UPI000783D386|nr:hypothetical protein [Demequina phytophila]